MVYAVRMQTCGKYVHGSKRKLHILQLFYDWTHFQTLVHCLKVMREESRDEDLANCKDQEDCTASMFVTSLDRRGASAKLSQV
jgi:hypothetical protein